MDTEPPPRPSRRTDLTIVLFALPLLTFWAAYASLVLEGEPLFAGRTDVILAIASSLPLVLYVRATSRRQR